MKTKIIILFVLALLILSGCAKQEEQKQVYEPEPKEDNLIISLEKIWYSGIQERYNIYNSGKYEITRVNNGVQELKKENKLLENDLNYLKFLINSKEFRSIPQYMEGPAADGCPTLILKIDYLDITKRSESCANTPESFNKIIESIEKLK